eukprot:scaffold232272_cov13-Tisochrysis_lutea.AAC.1
MPCTFQVQVAAVDEPKLHMWETGIMRITRHPQMVSEGRKKNNEEVVVFSQDAACLRIGRQKMRLGARQQLCTLQGMIAM